MKRSRISRPLLEYLATLAALTFFASAALYAEFNAGYYSDQMAERIHQLLPPNAPIGATYDAGVYPLFPAPLPPGTGRDEVNSFCNTCHSPRYITMQPPLPPETWAAEVNKMIKTHGASIPDDSTERIIRYLQTHFSTGIRRQ